MRPGGRTLITAIFGDPVEHSLSPAMHNAAYEALGLDRVYVAFHVPGERLRDAIRAIPALGIAGVNLTIPHKEQALAMVSRISAEARALGAINCVVNRKGVLFGDNTDARGLERDLRSFAVELSGRLAIIIGAGGGGAAAALACARLGARRIVIANRTRARGVRLARRLSRTEKFKASVEARELDILRDHAHLCEAALIVNATPMGLTSRRFARLDYAATSESCFFYDLLYAAEPTAFLKPAIELRRPTADGAGMLLYQAVLAFELFNGVEPPVEVMRQALMEGLGRSGASR
jgi:shikimate dehydrogenase